MSIPNYILIGCAHLSNAAYARPGDHDQAWERHAKDTLPSIGFSDIKTYVNSDSELLVATHYGYRIYAWRGTNSVADAITDLRFRKTPWYSKPGQKVHSGFQHGFRTLWDKREVERDLQVARSKHLKIVCTGHSLGAAKATIMAAYEIHRQNDIQGLVTFGSPRVGTTAFAASVLAGIEMSGGSVLRFVNLCDPVTSIPPYWRSTHVDSPMYFAADGSLKDRPSYGWVMLDRLLLTLSRWAGKNGSAFGDHAMAEYLTKTRPKYR